MKKNKIVKITDLNLLTDLKTSFCEHNSYLNILDCERKTNGYSEEYWKLWSQFMEVMSEYNTFKEKLRIAFIVPAVGENYPGWWEIDFQNKTVIIHDN